MDYPKNTLSKVFRRVSSDFSWIILTLLSFIKVRAIDASTCHAIVSRPNYFIILFTCRKPTQCARWKVCEFFTRRRSAAYDMYRNFLLFSIAEVVRAMNYVIQKGWVLYWGRLKMEAAFRKMFSHASGPLCRHLEMVNERNNGSIRQLP